MHNENMKQFLKEIKEVSDKHGLYINDGSCGCCGFTHIVDKENNLLVNRMLMFYDIKNNEYVIEEG